MYELQRENEDYKKNSKPNYKNFLLEVEKRGIVLRPYEKQFELKAYLLEKYFAKFSKNGKQPITKHSPSEIGKIFIKIYKEAEKYEDS